jgi:multiple sugar transport system substrate-binding protein
MRGITWDHPRAYQPLEAFQGRCPDAPRVTWDRQPLAGFEAHPISELAREYDLIVLDHPGLGAAVAANALTPLEKLFDPDELTTFEAGVLPVAWQSYQYAGSQWALPIDASTQVTVLRPDKLPRAPTTWTEVLESHAPFTLCLGGPHALLHALAISPQLSTEALDLLQLLWRRCDQQTSLLDPIGIHETLAISNELAYCPLVYGYATYSLPTPGAHALRWADAPSRGGSPGSVLGGTGLAVSRRADAEAQAWIRAYLAEEVQTVLVPATAGQPAHRLSWERPQGPLGEYCAATRASMLAAWTRPRADGWIPFQNRASELIRDCIITGSSTTTVAAELNRQYDVFRGEAR